ncbi:MAG: ATP-dependent helicase, partial [Candidatus Nanopelagicales bacterium]
MTSAPPAAKLSPELLPEILGIPFTDEQLAAITSPSSASVVIAGAGSGKTAVMSARVVWLVGSGTLPPEQVLGLTFTNKAAAELSQRVRLALERLAGAGYVVTDEEPTISTYHAYAASLLREYGLRAGLEPGAQLMVDATSFQLAERVVRRADGPFSALRLKVRALTEAVVALDNEMNEHLVSVDAVRSHDARLLDTLSAVEQENGKLTTRPHDAKQAALARTELLDLVAAFRREKVRRDVVDFGDQMAGAAVLAEAFSEIGEAERSRFGAVLLDEYQDTSIAQKRLLLALFGQGYPITAVGDPFQAIYGWRGASVSNIMEFTREFSLTDVELPAHALSQNNRSAANILELANAIAAPLREAHPNVTQLQPRPDLSVPGEISLALFPTQADEVDAISDDIAQRIGHGESPSHIAVLCRETKAFPDIYGALSSRG